MAKGKKVNRSELAGLYGVSLPTVDSWVRRGMPYVTKGARGKEWTFDTAAVAEWHAEQAVVNAIGDTAAVDENELKRRKLAAETTVVEIEAAKARGEVVAVEDVIQIIRDDYISLKQRMRTIPDRVTALIIGETDETRIKQELSSEIDDALTELSNRFYGGEEDAPSEDQPEQELSEAAAEADDIGMGGSVSDSSRRQRRTGKVANS